MNKTHLTLSDRLRIEGMLNTGHNFADISREIGKDRSTVSREVRNHTTEVKKATFVRLQNDCLHRQDCPASENCELPCQKSSCRNCRKGCSPRPASCLKEKFVQI